jgi:hypothetical protein
VRDLIQPPPNKALHQTRRGGAAASRPVVEARLAGERQCYADSPGKRKKCLRSS